LKSVENQIENSKKNRLNFDNPECDHLVVAEKPSLCSGEGCGALHARTHLLP
jgi:hypothetical protein